MTGVLVMLNNLLHDFSVALLFASLLALHLAGHPSFGVPQKSLRRLYGVFSRVMHACWAVIIAGGVVRTWAYREYEWMPAAGRGQVAALVAKHIILVAAVVLGIVGQVRLSRRLGR